MRVAFDTAYHHIFKYKYIPHTILVDRNGIVSAMTEAKNISEKTILDLIADKDVDINETENNAVSNLGLFIQFENDEYEYTISSENKNLRFKNEIKRAGNNKPVSLYFRNVSIVRLMTDIYGLTSVARISDVEEFISNDKYCFKLEQSNDCDKDLMENAAEILNSNLNIQAKMVEVDSVLVLEVIDKEKLPKISAKKEKYFEFRGPYFLGKGITSYNLIEYLENEVKQPIKDKVKLDYPFDMELDWNYEGGGKSLNKELAKYGLKISKSLKPEKVLMLELKKK